MQKFLSVSLFLSVSIFLCGYGYTGNLPQLGETTKTQEQPETQPSTEVQQAKPLPIIVPRASAGHKINNYTKYLTDIKEIDTLLREIKTILEEQKENKIQLFCAKVNVLNLYVDVLEEKYGEKPEKHYESYKQLIVLNKYLTEIVDYKRGIEASKETNKHTLEIKSEAEKYLKKKIEKTLIPINTVIEIIDETG
ncbi:MAG TPA: hypothetical protein P5556_04765 [Candidatus Gastranaerophilales bacterium]|nr:hypothetical protein [Candidatus Gastranaerophilales bacterium]